MWGKNIKNDTKEEYLVRKVVESFYLMKYNSPDSSSLDVEQIQISNKQELYSYLNDDFSNIFFTQGKLAQENMRIVGPTRLRTIHTKNKECKIKTDLDQCYYEEMNDDTVYTKDIDGIKYQTCEENQISNVIQGEQEKFGCMGYVLDIY